MCPGIELDEQNLPHFTSLCTNCGSNKPVCMQCCPHDAIVYISEESKKKEEPKAVPVHKEVSAVKPEFKNLPASLRLAIRGIGGQGNLFFGKVLSEMALKTPYANKNIVKGDTHGMAQLGGPVLSTFGCGEVYSSVMAPGSVDVLIVMEVSEILRPGFLGLLKKNGSIIINTFTSLPVNVKKEDYPKLDEIEKMLEGYNIIKTDAIKISQDLGDIFGKSANLVVLGVLSGLSPFDQIPVEIWTDAILAVSPSEISKNYNLLAFEIGRKEIVKQSQQIIQ